MMRRGVSNPRKSQGSVILQNEAGKMEEKLKTLKQAMDKQKDQREDNMRTSGSRWKAAATNIPLNNYAAKVLDKKTQPTSSLQSQGNVSAQGSVLKSESKKTSAVQVPKTSLPLSRPNSSRQSISRNGKENKISLNNSLWKTQEQPQSERPPSSSSSLGSSRKSIEITAGRPPSGSSFSLRPGSVKSQGSLMKQKVNADSLNMSSQKDDEEQEESLSQSSSNKVISRKVMAQTKLNELMPSSVSETKKKESKIIPHKGDTDVASNILKHLALQKEIQKEVHQFLATLNLTQYLKVFEDNGFDDLETIEEISTEYMNSMKIPAAHQIKIMNRIEVLKKEKKEVEELHRKKELKDSVSESESSKIKNIVLYPKKEIPKQQEIVIVPKQNQQDQPKKAEKSSESSTGGELLKGTFDEQESHNSFLEALMQFRGQKKLQDEQIIKEPENVDAQKKGVRFAEDVADNEGKGKISRKIKSVDVDDGTIRGSVSMIVHPPEEQVEDNDKQPNKPVTSFFFYSTGDNEEWSNADYPSSQDAGIETANPARLPKRDIHKISCYQCFKLVEVGTEKTMNIKNFCSDKCLAAYQRLSQVRCECGKIVLKEDCCFVRAKWYCSESCALGFPLKQEQNEENRQDIKYLDEIEEPIVDLEFGSTHSKVMSLDALEDKYKNIRQPSKDRQSKISK